MTVDGAFDTYQGMINADIAQVRLARSRRDTFKKAFNGRADVVAVFGSGSLARSTQLKPIHDVDLVVIYDYSDHPDWGTSGGSAQAALEHVQVEVVALLGSNGSVDQLVRATRAAGRSRAVKCFIDDPDDEDAFTVDVMPALRLTDGTLLLPNARENRWDQADPEYLIDEVEKRQEAWPYFREMVRVLKDWRLDPPVDVKSLVIEVLALKCLPTTGSRQTALRDFFAAAATEVMFGVEDPAGYCGPIQPDLDVVALSAALLDAHGHAKLACSAEASGDHDTAKGWWRKVFGDDFPGGRTVPVAPAVTAPAVVERPRPVKDAPQG